MAKTLVYNLQGEKIGEESLPEKISTVKAASSLVHQVVVAELANSRRAIAHSKTRGEVRGGGKKPWKQKGTGRARAGSIRSPLWRGGGVTFGPRNVRNFSKKTTRSQFQQALGIVLAQKTAENELFVLDKFALEKVSTKNLRSQLQFLRDKLHFKSKALTILTAKRDLILEKSARNLPSVSVGTVVNATPYSLLKGGVVLVIKDALSGLEKRLK